MTHRRTGLSLWVAAILTTITACYYWDRIMGRR